MGHIHYGVSEFHDFLDRSQAKVAIVRVADDQPRKWLQLQLLEVLEKLIHLGLLLVVFFVTGCGVYHQENHLQVDLHFDQRNFGFIIVYELEQFSELLVTASEDNR